MSNIILGLDPGVATTGFGLIREQRGAIELVECGYIETQKDQPAADRLLILTRALDQLIRRRRPDKAAIEKLFFAKNRTTAIAVAQARGVLLSVLAKHGVPITEFTPLQVKQALTGDGRADKRQMQKMVKTLLRLQAVPRPDDSADALAIAICAVQSNPVRNR